MGKFIDLTGKRFGKLVVISKTNKKQCNHILWVCKCDCGNIKEITGAHLCSGYIQSCGCLRKETCSKIGKENKIHGKEGTRLYKIWVTMRQRCNSLSATGYLNYGGRGIKICEEWNNFENFYNWAINNGYDDNAKQRSCSLDRIDVNGDYCPENCRWADAIVQANNRRNNRLIRAFGKEMTLTQWSKLTGININTLKNRLNRGWSAEDSLTIPIKHKNKKVNNNA